MPSIIIESSWKSNGRKEHMKEVPRGIPEDEQVDDPRKRSWLRHTGIVVGLTALGVGGSSAAIDLGQEDSVLRPHLQSAADRVRRLFQRPSSADLSAANISQVPIPTQGGIEETPKSAVVVQERPIGSAQIPLSKAADSLFFLVNEDRVFLSTILAASKKEIITEKYKGQQDVLAADTARVRQYDPLLEYVQKTYGFPKDFFGMQVAKGMMLWESRGEEQSPTGGLFQIENIALQEVNNQLVGQGGIPIAAHDLHRPDVNTYVAFFYLQFQYEQFGDPSFAVLGFHNGTAGVQESLKTFLKERGKSDVEISGTLGNPPDYKQLIKAYHITLPAVTNSPAVKARFVQNPKSLEYVYLVTACEELVEQYEKKP